AVNQVELHPSFQQQTLRQFHDGLGIVTEAWSPLNRGADLREPTVVAIAAETGCTPAQVVISWMVQEGIAVFPKTASRQRLGEHMAALDFELNTDQMAAMTAIPDSGRAFFDPIEVD
ncbi:MAG: aldo/keto reductase, partial [Micrococcales bacterium]|nr:aldo/keto reductase [Micrococcales bacterium]